ncbi:MAG: Mini-ribonuclease 3 [Syntrophomonadaceae bacterium]|jgi:ribonuclease-3 family protein
MPEAMDENELRQYSAIVLAFIGDAVFELMVRSRLVALGNRKVKDLHLDTVARVKAASQAKMVQELHSELNEAEQDVFRRGRNAKLTPPRHADMTDYRMSTGFEAVLGYLYLKGDEKRLQYLAERALHLDLPPSAGGDG